uniref:Ubiquitin thioesterase OTU n=1 Tax=Zooxanthella nutricula TaxID=1333877 RepID=A0A6U6PK25_9DINO
MAAAPLTAIRRRVKDDHSCLFWAFAYLAEGCEAGLQSVSDPGEAGRAKVRELREACAQDALKDPDPMTRALLLDVGSVEAYASKIRDKYEWGGENEVLALARHYSLEVALVNCESLQVMCYGSDVPDCKGRVHILYTGQHYDPLVAGVSPDAPPSAERRCFAQGDGSLEAAALEAARAHNAEAARRAKQKRVKKIKCLGCGQLLSDAEAFAMHCQEVEHDDDFAYECENVEVVIEGDEPLPEGSIDLASDSVHTFNNVAQEALSNLHATPVTIGATKYHSLEHYWLCAQYIGQDDAVAASIASAASTEQAAILAHGASPHSQRPDWRERRAAVMLEAMRAKVSQNPAFAEMLRATGEKTIVCVDTDPWAGMQAPGGIATGQNNVGKCMMEVRGELRSVRSI